MNLYMSLSLARLFVVGHTARASVHHATFPHFRVTECRNKLIVFIY